MKHTHNIMMLAGALSVVGSASLGAQQPSSSRDANSGAHDYRSPSSSRTYSTDTSRLGRVIKSTDLIGKTVNNRADEKLGKIDELAIDVPSGRLVYVVLSTGELAGMGGTLHAVPPGALRYDAEKEVVQLDVDKEKIKMAPKFDMGKWSEQSDANHVKTLYRHYGTEPDFTFASAGSMRDRERDEKKADKHTADSARNPWGRVTEVRRASKIVGMPVHNLQNTKLGDVENLSIDLDSGRVVAVVISSGGFLGIGDELSAVPPSALRVNRGSDGFLLDATKESMTSAPRFRSNQWPDFGEATYTGEIYRAYRTEPYFSTKPREDKMADNTARNVRDRDNRQPTPLDQGNNQGDLDITQRIRRDVMAFPGLSTNARNVKIITTNGHVTLRGPVATEEEKRRIAEAAGNAAGGQNVDNQLEVKK